MFNIYMQLKGDLESLKILDLKTELKTKNTRK